MLHVRSTRSLKRISNWRDLFAASVIIGSRWLADGKVATVKARDKKVIVAEVQFGAECNLVTYTHREFADKYYHGKL